MREWKLATLLAINLQSIVSYYSMFKFKQFTIKQDRCAFKVGTDGLLLGAWSEHQGCNKALDIGTGTGVLTMAAAKAGAKI